MAEFVAHHVQVPCIVVQVVGVPSLEVGTEAGCIGREAHHVEVGDAARSGVFSAGEQVHQVALDAGQVAVVLPLQAESVQHGVGIVRDAVVRIGGFPHVDVRGLHVDERVDAFRVDGVYPGQDGEGPFHRRVAVVAECAVRVEVDVDGHFDAIGELIGRRWRRLNSHGHYVPARSVFVHSALKFRWIGCIGDQEQHVLAVRTVANGAQVVLAAAVLEGAHDKILHHDDGALNSR